MDLARTSVFLDFDGTISVDDVGRHLLERFADPAWREVDRRYDTGEIGSRECLLDEWDLLLAGVAEPAPDAPRLDEHALRAAAREVALDPGFVPLVEGLQAAGAEVSVVSDGFGYFVREACAGLDLRVFTNAVDFVTGRLDFPYQDRCCACSSCGVCKQAPIKDAAHQGRTTVMIGDGISDRKAALLADVVFAKGPLARWCAAAGVDHRPFTTLGEVRDALLGTAVAPAP